MGLDVVCLFVLVFGVFVGLGVWMFYLLLDAS